MKPQERQDLILSRLRVEGQVLVKDLAREFQVTEDRIRKDLTVMEKNGLLKRVHGGAIVNRSNLHTFDVQSRKGLNIDEKKQIAKKAVSLIEPDSMVFLDVSTISTEIAREIIAQNLPITVVTNMIDVMRMFLGDTNIRLIFIGGEFNRAKDGFIGSLVNEQIQKFKFDLAFIGTVGIDPNSLQVYTYDSTDGLTKKIIRERAKNSYILAENPKYLHDGNYVFGSLDDFTAVISDNKVPEELVSELDKKGISIL